jgi:peptidoglycan/xylan/chitin deacetylase (PgdA/CDA1 family)
VTNLNTDRWIDYHNCSPEEEKAYIRKAIECIRDICGKPPSGWYYGRLSPRSRALVWDVYKEMGIPLLWESDSYADDVPYWVDVPAEADSPNPEGMLMIPYSYDCNGMSGFLASCPSLSHVTDQ